MHWIALQPALPDEPTPPGAAQPARPSAAAPSAQPLQNASLPDATPPDATLLAWRALQFTPRVALVDGAVLMEIAASERLFGGGRPLLQQFFEQIPAYPSVRWSYGATSLIAIGRLWQQLQQSHTPIPHVPPTPPVPRRRSVASPSAEAITFPRKPTPPAQLPLAALAAARPHLPTLERLGCRNWGDLRALPRGGLSRRFGSELLAALDRAWGVAPEVYPWLTLPEHFDEPLELPALVETAPALLFGVRRLLARLHTWLQLRQQGVLALRLGWQVDRRRNVPPEGNLLVRTAEPTLDMAHIERLLAENLAQTRLAAPAHTLRLTTVETARLDGASASLLIDEARRGDSLHQLVERLGARLGPERVLCAVAHADHRPERMQAWVPVSEHPEFIAENHHPTLAMPKKSIKNGSGGAKWGVLAPGITAARPGKSPRSTNAPPTVAGVASAPPGPGADALYPTWLLAAPQRLTVQRNRPLYQGPLTLLAGPQRLESGWWEPDATGHAPAPAALRDYFLARSAQAGLLWIYRERLPPGGGAPSWFLHGLFA